MLEEEAVDLQRQPTESTDTPGPGADRAENPCRQSYAQLLVENASAEWYDFIKTDLYKNTKNEDQISYFWDELIQRTCQNALSGTLGGNSDLLRGQSAIFEMVKEPRFIRRALADKIRRTVVCFLDHQSQLTRQVTGIRDWR